MTRNAFGLTSPFNFEADVVLWDTNNKIINDLCQQQTEIADNLDDIIYADYNIERNRGRTSIDKLRTIEGEILSESLTLLDE